MKTTHGFSRRGPDRVAEELATVLSTKASFDFKSLFTVVFENLRLRNAAGGGEEMMRLRVFERLQNLVQSGIVIKNGKEYTGVPKALASFMATTEEQNAKNAIAPAAALPVPVKKAPAKKSGRKIPLIELPA